jgi:hypothetical protein
MRRARPTAVQYYLMILQVYRVIISLSFNQVMSKMKISEYFNPEQHLTLHQDKEGNMIGGGYQVNNLLYQRKMPLFVSLGNSGDGQGAMSGGAGGASAGAGSDDCENRHFIPEKFSDLFRDLAVPAGLFMMPPQFRPRNYAFDVPDEDATTSSRENKHGDGDGESSSSSDSSDDEDSESNRRKTVPTDIFDTLLALVTPTERIQHDVKTRRQRQQQHPNKADKKRQNKTRRTTR